MQRKVRVGLISTSWFAEWNLIPNTQSHPDAKLVSICGRQLDPAKDAEKNIALVIDAGKAIFGDHFVMVPEFGLSDEHATEWQNALSDSQSLLRYLENDQAKRTDENY